MPGSWAYFDTSVLVKRYVQEEGSSHARRLLRTHRILTSAIAPTEAISALSRRAIAALSRRRTLEELTAKHFSETFSRIKADRAYWELVEVSALVLKEAEEVILHTGLRTLDAIHLASILTFQNASGIQISFITGDSKQQEAAAHVGLDAVWVG
jgi:predicted nucleic acid-binding protein